PEPGGDNDTFDIDWLIDKAIAAVGRHGNRGLVIDPWNEVEHAMPKGENVNEYTGRAIRALKRFGREFECIVIVVAHPNKRASEKAPEDVSLYDISDTSHFANKADFGVVVARVGGPEDT
ncbi:AAA family ATPase, partial [Staphylococcus pseudintermedius]|uniref:AAA family ATPase n=1 Tax=Staphylococcus pseudintermedius TaxID=283734 RepID=UPI000E361B92